MTTVRCASIASRCRWKIGLARKSVLDMRQGLLHVPQFVIRADDLTSRHESYRNVGNVAFQPDQPLGSLEAFLVEAVPATTLTHNRVTQNHHPKTPPPAQTARKPTICYKYVQLRS